MKVKLVAINAKYIHSNLAVYDLLAYSRNNQVSIGEYTINNNQDNIVDSLYKEKADVYAFSCYIWNIEYVVNIAATLKSIMPNIKIWAGGPEVSYDAEHFLEKNKDFDLVMLGEGEETFKELALGMEYSDVKGITYREGDIFINNGIRPLMKMDDIPFVYSNIGDFENRIIYYESSRGCPFNCSYCLSSIDKSVRFRSLDLVFKELGFFLEHKVPQVKFVDRTFNCSKEHSRAIFNYIGSHDNGITNFHFEVSADLLTEEDFEIFKTYRPGLIQLEIGLQSYNLETIKAIRRTMDIEKLEHSVNVVNKLNNIHQHLDLIAGLPYEDIESFKTSFNKTYKLRPAQLQLGFLKVLKGSGMETMIKEYEILYRLTPPYEVVKTKWLSFDDVLELKGVEDMVEVYYNSSQFSNTLDYVMEYFESPYKFFYELSRYYEDKDLSQLKFKRIDRYNILREFLQKICCEKEEVALDMKLVNQLMLHDIFLRENAKQRQEWFPDISSLGKCVTAYFKNNFTDSKDAAKSMHVEHYAYDIFNPNHKAASVYVLYDYSRRNPLNNDALYKEIEL